MNYETLSYPLKVVRNSSRIKYLSINRECMLTTVLSWSQPLVTNHTLIRYQPCPRIAVNTLLTVIRLYPGSRTPTSFRTDYPHTTKLVTQANQSKYRFGIATRSHNESRKMCFDWTLIAGRMTFWRTLVSSELILTQFLKVLYFRILIKLFGRVSHRSLQLMIKLYWLGI